MLSLAPSEGSISALHSRVYEVGAHVHWLWHFHASPSDAASDICKEEYHLCREDKEMMSKHWSSQLSRLPFNGNNAVTEWKEPLLNVCVCLHTAVGQWHCVCVTRHALLLAVIGTGSWSASIAQVSIVRVYWLSPRPVNQQRLLGNHYRIRTPISEKLRHKGFNV